jgi:hypothetical protein
MNYTVIAGVPLLRITSYTSEENKCKNGLEGLSKMRLKTLSFSNVRNLLRVALPSSTGSRRCCEGL